jgi:hypothetical protein
MTRGLPMKIRTIVWGLVLTFATGGVAWSQSLADVARKDEERRKALKAPGKVYTNDDLRRYPVTTPDPPVQPADALPASPAEAAVAGEAKPAAPKDQEPSIDQGEDHWRQLMGQARAARARSDTYLEALQIRLAALTTDFYAQPDPAQKSAIWAQRTRVFDDMERLKKDMIDQDAAIAKIEEDARKANIPPGWIR